VSVNWLALGDQKESKDVGNLHVKVADRREGRLITVKNWVGAGARRSSRRQRQQNFARDGNLWIVIRSPANQRSSEVRRDGAQMT